MNHYAQALSELQAQPDHELKQIGDQWETPKPLAWGLFHHFAPTLGPVVIDMFADGCNHLVPNYYDAEDNALTQDMAADLCRLGGAAFGNPPYSRPCADSDGNPITGMEAILNFCREQRAQSAKIMLLIKAATSETWWPEDADFIQFISGRIGFKSPSWYVPRDPKKDKPSASGFASAVVIFDAGWQGERRPEASLRRDDLITTGEIILDMIHRQAVALNEAAKTLAPAELQEQPAVAESAAWEPPVASDDATNTAAADEQEMLERVSPIRGNTKLAELGYTHAGLIMAKQLEYTGLNEEQRDTVRGYVQGWLDEPYPLSEIFYRLDLAVANLLANQSIHQGFVAEDSRAPTLPHWQRHPAVKSIIYQIDDADILTPAKTAELAAWVIDNLTTDYDLLEMATTKAATLLHQEPADQPNDKPLADWAFDYRNDQLHLGNVQWRTFVAVLTVLYGIKENYAAREVAIAISVSDEELMDEYTTLPEDTKERLRHCASALVTVENGMELDDPQRQIAVQALNGELMAGTKTLGRNLRASVMRTAIKAQNNEDAAT
ncbi:phage N-6-adenine-methyltransferase [Aeromonas hydrophila]|uniref:phage N-6-adenine-methyltransferase n=1 Tax=Aeromonas hydrophila TaxID=644 RepID=UPI000A717FF1|nr:phage N-6-adenine-methyltransferase [Aeromonas hydrophila]